MRNIWNEFRARPGRILCTPYFTHHNSQQRCSTFWVCVLLMLNVCSLQNQPQAVAAYNIRLALVCIWEKHTLELECCKECCSELCSLVWHRVWLACVYVLISHTNMLGSQEHRAGGTMRTLRDYDARACTSIKRQCGMCGLETLYVQYNIAQWMPTNCLSGSTPSAPTWRA